MDWPFCLMRDKTAFGSAGLAHEPFDRFFEVCSQDQLAFTALK